MPELKFHRSYRDGIEVRVIDEEQRVIDYVASTEAPDRGEDLVRVAGWLTRNFQKNPVLPWAHDYSQLPVARALAVKKDTEAKRLLIRAQFAGLDQFHPHAESVFRMAVGGFLSAGSVGFMPLKWQPRQEPNGTDAEGNTRMRYMGREFLKQDLLEFSPCVVPMNPEALIDTAKRAFGDSDAARKFIHDVQSMGPGASVRAYEIEEAKAPEAIRHLLGLVDSATESADPLEDKGWGDFSDPTPYEVRGAPAETAPADETVTVPRATWDAIEKRLADLEARVAAPVAPATETVTTTVERTVESAAEVDFAPLLAHVDQRFTELREHIDRELEDLFVDRAAEVVRDVTQTNDVTQSHDAPPAQARGVEDSPPASLPTPGGQGAAITLDAETLSKIATLIDERVNAGVDRRIGAIRAPGGSK